MAGDRDPRPACDNAPPGGVDARNLAVPHHKSLHFAVLDDVDAQRVCRSCVTPCDSIMTSGAGTALKEGAPDRKAGLARIVEIGQELHYLAAVEELGVDPIEAHDVAAARKHVETNGAVRH